MESESLPCLKLLWHLDTALMGFLEGRDAFVLKMEEWCICMQISDSDTTPTHAHALLF